MDELEASRSRHWRVDAAHPGQEPFHVCGLDGEPWPCAAERRVRAAAAEGPAAGAAAADGA